MDTSGIRHVVFIVHGIRDYAPWQSAVVRGLGNETTKVVPIKIGRYPTIYFLSPIPFHFWKRRKVEKQIRSALHQYRNARVSIIAHSFGTYLVSRVLERGKFDDRIHRIILCGSVIRESFNWDGVKQRVDGPPLADFILNDCGNADPWPAIAEAASWRYGRTGTHGFGDIYVTDRIHNGGHSVFLTEDFAREWWLPFIANGTIKPAPAAAAENLCPVLVKACSPPYLYFVRLAVLAVYAAILYLSFLGLTWAWGLVAPYFIPVELDSAALTQAIKASDSWSISQAIRETVWEFVEVPVHAHGTINRVSGETVDITFDAPPGSSPATAELLVDEPAVVATARANEGRKFCIRGRLDSIIADKVRLTNVPNLVVYHKVGSIAALQTLPTGVVASVEGIIKTNSIEDGTCRCEIESPTDPNQRLIARMQDGEDVSHLKQGDKIILQGRYARTVNTPHLNRARRLSNLDETEFHATEVHSTK